MLCVLFLFFFFQAEYGIRSLVRSRGLGDVYKRQAQRWLATLDEASQQLDGSGVRIALENSGYPPHEAGRRILGQLPDLLAFAEQQDLDLSLIHI